MARDTARLISAIEALTNKVGALESRIQTANTREATRAGPAGGVAAPSKGPGGQFSATKAFDTAASGPSGILRLARANAVTAAVAAGVNVAAGGAQAYQRGGSFSTGAANTLSDMAMAIPLLGGLIGESAAFGQQAGRKRISETVSGKIESAVSPVFEAGGDIETAMALGQAMLPIAQREALGREKAALLSDRFGDTAREDVDGVLFREVNVFKAQLKALGGKEFQ